MKKQAIFAFSLLVAAGLATVSCSQQSATPAPVQSAVTSSDDNSNAGTLNIRYVDGDSLMANYNLAKDVQEFILKTHSRLDQAQQSRANEIQRFAGQIEDKGRNNGYLSQESYNADMQRLQKMQQDAENYLASMQRTAQKELEEQNRTLNDSIDAFIKEFSISNGYDAVVLKASGLYFNPALDVTSQVVDGLNRRYNKVGK